MQRWLNTKGVQRGYLLVTFLHPKSLPDAVPTKQIATRWKVTELERKESPTRLSLLVTILRPPPPRATLPIAPVRLRSLLNRSRARLTAADRQDHGQRPPSRFSKSRIGCSSRRMRILPPL